MHYKDYPKILVKITDTFESLMNKCANLVTDIDTALDKTPRYLRNTDHTLSETDKIYANIRFLKFLSVVEMIGLVVLAIILMVK